MKWSIIALALFWGFVWSDESVCHNGTYMNEYTCILNENFLSADDVQLDEFSSSNAEIIYIRNYSGSFPQKVFSLFQSVKYLAADRNEISGFEVEAFISAESLKVLRLEHNLLEELLDYTFKGAHNLQRLNLNGNKITKIQPNAFNGLASLENLKLSSNGLKSLNEIVFSSLPNLKYIDLSHNLLEFLHRDLFKHENNMFLKIVNLEGNVITSLHSAMFRHSSNLLMVFLQDNICIDENLVHKDMASSEEKLIPCSQNYIDMEKMNQDFIVERVFPKHSVFHDNLDARGSEEIDELNKVDVDGEGSGSESEMDTTPLDTTNAPENSIQLPDENLQVSARRRRENETNNASTNYYQIPVEYAHLGIQGLLVIMMCFILYVVGSKFKREIAASPAENANFMAEQGILLENM